MPHFLDLQHIPADTLRQILTCATELKINRIAGKMEPLLAGKKLAMIFEKNSTRTRVSFEVAMLELGGHALPFSSHEMQLGRGETVGDTARVLSRYVDAIMVRCHSHATLAEMAQSATVPIINGLSDTCHPCQVMADILTFEEHRGPIAGRTLAWVGDGNNMAATFVAASAQFNFKLRIACPPELLPSFTIIDWAKTHGGNVELTSDPAIAVAGADAVIADTWVSMGDKDAAARIALLAPYQVNAALMKRAASDALFLHCLPAHRGEEVTAEIIDGPQSIVWDEAENRLHAQKAILLWCLGVI